MTEMPSIAVKISQGSLGAVQNNSSNYKKASRNKRMPMYNTFISLWLTAAFILIFFAHPLPSYCQSYVVTGEIEVDETYDDNVDYDDITDLITSIRPSLGIQGGTQKTSWNLQGLLEHRAHYQEDDKDRTNRSASFFINHAFSPRWNASLNTSLALDHTLDQSIEEFAIVVTPTKRLSTTIAPSTTYYIDSTNVIEVSGQFTKQHAESESVADQTNKSASVTWSRQLDEVSSIITTGSYSNIVSELPNRTTDQNVRRISIGYERQWTEDLSSTFSIGPSFSTTTNDFDPGPELEEDQRSLYVDGSINWEREKSTYSLSINRQQTQSTLGDPTTRTGIRISARYLLTERLTSSFSMSYTYSERGQDDANESEHYSISPRLRYTLAENLYLGLNYTHSIRRDITDDTSEDRNRISLSLRKTFSELFD